MKKYWLKLGFTLIEILCVLIIIWIIVGFSTIKIKDSQKKARDMIRKNDLQMIADALISYNNDYGHFPSSIYDNVSDWIWKTPWQALKIIDALKSLDEWCDYYENGNDITWEPNEETVIKILNNADNEIIWKYTTIIENAWGSSNQWHEWSVTTKVDWDSLKKNSKNNTNSTVSNLVSAANTCENERAKVTRGNNANFAIVTQWMCASNLKKYLVNNWYISQIPQDPLLESVHLETNICIEPWTPNKKIDITKWVNANDSWWSLNGLECYADTNLWCTQICKAWYVYVSDWEHFALIAHMESKNNWNYETTACGSCEVAWECKPTNEKTWWTSTEQLPCDITDEFTNTFDCIQNTWVVEYSTWEYYFYIY